MWCGKICLSLNWIKNRKTPFRPCFFHFAHFLQIVWPYTHSQRVASTRISCEREEKSTKNYASRGTEEGWKRAERKMKCLPCHQHHVKTNQLQSVKKKATCTHNSSNNRTDLLCCRLENPKRIKIQKEILSGTCEMRGEHFFTSAILLRQWREFFPRYYY